MGEYMGRRRGRPASEPPAEEPGYGYYPEYGYEQQQAEYQEYFDVPVPAPAAEYSSYEYYEAPSYETPSYETYNYEAAPYVEPEAYVEPHGSRRGQPSPEEMYAPDYGHPSYNPADEYADGYANSYRDAYVDDYAEPYADNAYADDTYVDDYAEPRFEPRRRSGTASPSDEADPAPASYAPAPRQTVRAREPRPLLAHLPFIGLATAGLVIASFVSVKAIAAVVLPLQVVVAWAVLDLAGYASRRTAALTALPALAATAGTFKFAADEAATAIAGGLGVGFVLVAADAVFRARRRGVEPGAARAVAAAASALLFAGLTGMFVPAARLDTVSVAIGAAIGGVLALGAARNPELGSSRAAVVALPATAAALASYAAAILVP
ncbi:MAG: hypothetical protein JF587_24040 [Catenulisporales bacterium]|nr:hypothetical protein [Catenulisporales bacterium]